MQFLNSQSTNHAFVAKLESNQQTHLLAAVPKTTVKCINVTTFVKIMQLSVKLLFIVNGEQLSLNAFGQTVLDITNAKGHG